MTNFVRQKYQYFVDMETKTDTMQVINITAGGLMPQLRLRPFFSAFKYFKLGKVSVRFVPAATLPVDPTGLSYEAGEQTVDPRDQMNPGLVRITNGEDISSLATILVGGSAERSYYATMLDPRWYKFQLQRGFRRTAKPLLWNVGQTHQAMGQAVISDKNLTASSAVIQPVTAGFGFASVETAGSSVPTFEGWHSSMSGANDYMPYALVQTGRLRMGWMPTDMFNSGEYGPSPVPEVQCITCILPKAYKTKYFYRCYIEEEILFKDSVSFEPVYSTLGSDGYPITTFNTGSIDRFVTPGVPVATSGNNRSDATPLDDFANFVNGGDP